MRAFLDLAIAFTRAWVAVYTRGLPHDIKGERREEIDCDLWHQQRLADLERQSVSETAVEILLRLLLGMPADLLWRLETGASIQTKGKTSVNDRMYMRIGFLAAMLPLAILAVMGASFMLGNGDWDNTTEHWIWRAFFVACPVIGVFGLWLCAARPRLGMGLVLAGVGASAFLMPWMAFVTVPFGIAIMTFAAFRAGFRPRSSSRQPAG